jgi:hypothetical protein
MSRLGTARGPALDDTDSSAKRFRTSPSRVMLRGLSYCLLCHLLANRTVACAVLAEDALHIAEADVVIVGGSDTGRGGPLGMKG